MKTNLRTTVAALALLAPLGAAVAQVTVQFGPPAVVAQAQPQVHGPRIDRFVLTHEGRIQPGEELRFRLMGTPGSRATLEVPGELRVAMTETAPGVYSARYVVRRDDNANAFPRAVATLDNRGRSVSANVDVMRDLDERDRRDKDAPRISDLTPADGERLRERGWTEISAKVTDDRSGVDRRSVVLRVDGRDVTSRVRFEGDQVRFRDDLREGRHVAELTVRDEAGNTSRRSWSFEVHDRGRHNGYGYGYGRDR